MSEIKLYNEDCLKVMEGVADNSIDLVCSDVPYLVTSRGNSGSMGGYVTNKLAMCGKIFENNSPSLLYLPHIYLRFVSSVFRYYIQQNHTNILFHNFLIQLISCF